MAVKVLELVTKHKAGLQSSVMQQLQELQQVRFTVCVCYLDDQEYGRSAEQCAVCVLSVCVCICVYVCMCVCVRSLVQVIVHRACKSIKLAVQHI